MRKKQRENRASPSYPTRQLSVNESTAHTPFLYFHRNSLIYFFMKYLMSLMVFFYVVSNNNVFIDKRGINHNIITPMINNVKLKFISLIPVRRREGGTRLHIQGRVRKVEFKYLEGSTGTECCIQLLSRCSYGKYIHGKYSAKIKDSEKTIQNKTK